MESVFDSTENWFMDDADSETIDYPIHEYDINSSPSDWNIISLYNFVERETIYIPGFQRNYVWDIKRASKLIESLLIGLPIPQLFLYEKARNKFTVIDGQQRLMTIYYFVKQRFPKKEKRSELRLIFDNEGRIPDQILFDENYFTPFRLNLPTQIPNQRNKFSGLVYATLGDYQSTFDLRSIRSIIVKQISPEGDDSSVYELFNRLNSGGVNLTAQEIRTSLYHSDFYTMLYRVNTNIKWRRLVGLSSPDLHAKDVEFMLRAFAMLIKGNEYSSTMLTFLNDFSRIAKNFTETDILYLEQLFQSFLQACEDLPDNAFIGASKRFTIPIFESVFVAASSDPYRDQTIISGKITSDSLIQLKSDKVFLDAAEKATANTSNVKRRLIRATEIIRVV